MKRTFTKYPVLANSMTDEFLRYHEDANNYRNNEAGFNKMYTILDKYGSDDEDVDVLFERATDEDKKKMLSLIKPVKASSQERGTVQTYRNRRNPNKYIEVKKGNDGHSYARQYMEWDRPDGKVKNYTGAKDAKRGRYSRARRDTIDQMLDDYDAIESSSAVTSGFSFDFIWTGKTYDDKEIQDTIEDIFDRLCLPVLGVDFEHVDYSMYPEYANKNVSQCHVDFEWSDNYADTEIEEIIVEMTEERLRRLGYEVIGTDFYTI